MLDLSGARVAVTGAAGFIGGAVAARLREAGADVLALDLREAPGTRALDVTDAAAVRAALRGADGVVHAAAVLGDRGGHRLQVEVNVRGTRNVLDGAGDARVVHVSSVAAWGYEFPADLPSEDAPLRQTGEAYVDTKAASEALARRRGAAVVRPGDVHGPGSEPWVLRPLRALRARRLVLPDGGRGVITPVFVDDLVDCLLLALRHPDAAGQAFTAHDGTPVPAREFFAFHAGWLGRRRVPTAPGGLLRAVAAASERVDHARGAVPEVTTEALTYVSRRAAYPSDRAREVLGWVPRVGLAEGMARTERWLREEGHLPQGPRPSRARGRHG